MAMHNANPHNKNNNNKGFLEMSLDDMNRMRWPKSDIPNDRFVHRPRATVMSEYRSGRGQFRQYLEDDNDDEPSEDDVCRLPKITTATTATTKTESGSTTQHATPPTTDDQDRLAKSTNIKTT